MLSSGGGGFSPHVNGTDLKGLQSLCENNESGAADVVTTPASEGGRYKNQENTRAGRDAGATKDGILLGFESSHTDSSAPT